MASPNIGGAVHGGGRKEGGGIGGLLSGATLRGRSGVKRITSVIEVLPCDSPAIVGERGGVSGTICKPSSSSAALWVLSLATITYLASSAPVRPRASALPWLLRCTTRLVPASSLRGYRRVFRIG